ncbi:MAG: hypothetical protein K1X89_09740 [Myxococcaceae bacterium]|nr:hypothetical protein [Myxococcaceae bacterium]
MRGVVVAVAIGGIALSGCAPGPGVGGFRFACTTDADCADGFTCQAQECVSGSASGGGQGGSGGGSAGGTGGAAGGGQAGGGAAGGGAAGGGQAGGGSGGGAGGGSTTAVPALTLSGPQALTVDQCSPGFVVGTLFDGGPASVDAGAWVNLSSSSPAFTFFSDVQCTQDAGRVAFQSDGGALFFTLARDAGTTQFTATAAGFAQASASVTAQFQPAYELALTNLPAFVRSGDCQFFRVALRDDAGQPARANAATVVTVTADAGPVPFGGAPRLYLDSFCQNPAGQATIAAGSSQAGLFVRGATGVPVELKATASALSTTASLDVRPLVRRGSCVIPDGGTGVDCAVSPPQGRLDQTLLVFQAETDSAVSAESGVRCKLANASTVHCEREAAGPAAAKVSWQTAEHRSFEVDRFDAQCDGGNGVVTVPGRNSLLTESFVLVSSSQDSPFIDTGDFVAVTQTGQSTLDLNFSGCLNANPTRAHVQVVGINGLSVKQGSASLAVGSHSTTANALGNANEPIALYSYRPLDNNGTGELCDCVVSGTVTKNSATFTRGVNTAGATCAGFSVPNISFNRIDFQGQARTQSVTVQLVGQSLTTSAATQSFDVTRTLYFSGSQGPAGQALGESDDTSGNFYLGVAAASFVPEGSGLSATSVRVTRGRAGPNALFTVNAVEFLP